MSNTYFRAILFAQPGGNLANGFGARETGCYLVAHGDCTSVRTAVEGPFKNQNEAERFAANCTQPVNSAYANHSLDASSLGKASP